MENIEIKIAISDFVELKKRLGKIKAIRHGILAQSDTYYNCENGRLKLREINNERFELIYYDRPDSLSSKLSKYEILVLNNEQAMQLKMIMALAYGEKVIVRKKRELWTYKNTRIHLDMVDKIGNFVELETVINNISFNKGKNEHNEVIQALEINEYAKVDKSYGDLSM